MEDHTILILSLVLLVSFFLFLKTRRRQKLNLPPSPQGRLPVIGHLHLLKPPIHRTLHSLSETLGGAPIISLSLGSHLVYVVSSHSIAEECFTKNDIVLANRPPATMGKHVGYNFTDMVSAPYGDHWRNLRRIGAVEIFSTHRLNTFLSVRKDEIRRLIIRLSRANGSVVEMRSLLTDVAFNNIMRMVAGKRYYGDDMEDDEEARRARDLMKEVIESSGAGNPVDYLPVLNWVSDYEKKVKKLAGRMDEFLQGLIDEKRSQKEKGNTMIDHLLSLQESRPEYYTDQIIKGIILVMVVGGTDTSAVTLEWTLSNLLNHPDILKKARFEIDNQIGSARLIDESDISHLSYLQSIVHENLRLYPAGPMLLSHMASGDCTIAGYNMPRNTTLLVNAWAIHRDPKMWEDPTSFKPERFENEREVQKLMAFGLGRRACPGSGLAQRLVGLTLGSLIQCFEWERVGEEMVDMKEGKGLTMPKETPLQAICKARPIVKMVISANV